MARIASHHSKNHPLPVSTEFRLSQPWPDDCRVQWGTNPIWPTEDDPVRSAFFEAFPEEGGSIRGEGSTIEGAEEKAYKKYRQEAACDHPHWRRKHLDGLGICNCCGKSESRHFHKVTRLGEFREPMDLHELHALANAHLRTPPADVEKRLRARGERAKHNRELATRARYHGIDLPPVPAERQTDGQFMGQEPCDYQRACAEIILDWIDNHPAAEKMEPIYRDLARRRVTQELEIADRRDAKLKR